MEDMAGDCPQRLSAALQWGIRLLAAHGVDSPRLDAELLLAHVLGVERPWLLIHGETELAPGELDAYSALIRRALDDEPVAYLLGERPFYDISLHVTPDVLIPRPESEHLLEQALAWEGAPRPGLRIIDVGTGSGALAIVLARHLPQARIHAVDLSPEALAVAQQNAHRLGVAGAIRFQQSDLLTAASGPWDLVVANLPYVDPLELPALQASVRRWEPRLALDGGPGGTAIIERLIDQLTDALGRPSLALLECDPRQAARLAERAGRALPKARVQVVQDLAGWDRIVRIELPAPSRPPVITQVWPVCTAEERARGLQAAVQVLARGGLVVFPTDTVYGVGCNLADSQALQALYAAKGRPANMPIPVLLSDAEEVHQVARAFPAAFWELAESYWPGGLTLILPALPSLDPVLTAGGSTVGVRLPDLPLARALIRAAGGALAVTSANRSGHPAAVTAQDALNELNGRVELLLAGEACRGGVASTVVNLSVSPPRLLRAGALSAAELRQILPDLDQ